jgi:hypothetical protein
MRNIKKSLFLAIAMVIATTLVFSNVSSVQVTEETEEINELKVSKSELVAQKMSIPTQTVDLPLMQAEGTTYRGEVAFGDYGDQLHPAFDRAIKYFGRFQQLTAHHTIQVFTMKLVEIILQ